MTNQFIEPLKTFFEITRENLKWVASEIQHQYFLSTLRHIKKKYPELHTEVEAFTEHLDAIFYGITDDDCPDFVEPPEEYELDPDLEYNAKFEAALQQLKRNRQELIDSDPFYAPKDDEDGLNEPDYPYDTEPSA